MLRNYLAAAMRNLVRNKLYAAINIVGLAVGFAAALLIALFVRDELSYDKWIPGHERTYAVLMLSTRGAAPPTKWSTTVIEMAELLKLDFPSIESVARLRLGKGYLRRGDFELFDTIYSADPDIFRLLPLPAIAGDLDTALNEPDSIVMTRRMARKYFGRDNPLGETIELNHKYPLRLTAVLEDLPSNTHLNTEIIMSGRAPYSLLALLDAMPPRGPNSSINVAAAYTYIRLKPGASIDSLREATPAFVGRHLNDIASTGVSRREEPVFVPITDLHLTHFGDSPMTPPGSLTAIKALIAVGIIIISLAAINFINLMTARASRRVVEVGIRKVSGARRWDLVVQFIGEAGIYVVLSMALAVALADVLLPAVNGYLQRSIGMHVVGNRTFLFSLIGWTVGLGLVAGFYPAFILSAFRPAEVLKGGVINELRSTGRVRQSLVILQFAAFIGLVVVTSVMFFQTSYAENEALRLDKDQILLIQTACRSAFKDEVAKLPGVQAASCSGREPLNHDGFPRVFVAGGPEIDVALDYVDFGFFELYGLHPLTGRFFSRDRGKDSVATGGSETQPNVVINASAAAKFGFASPLLAIGQSISFARFDSAHPGKVTAAMPAEIVGVVPDFPTGTVNSPIRPSVFVVDPGWFQTLQVKLNGNALPETLRAINQLWAKYTDFPLTSSFFDQSVQALYLDITRESQLLAAFSAIAIFIACLGLLGLAASTAERRTKEIGIRKSMGASNTDILRLLIWRFIKPVLWANVIAWPVGYSVMRRWLAGFAYHIALSPWIFLGASALALVIAVLTVAGHALLVARSQPVAALRYE